MASRITAAATSEAGTEQLWELVSDLERWQDHLDTFTSVTALQPGPTRVGSRFRVRQPGLSAVVYEVTQWWEGVGFVWETRGPGLVGTAEHEISPLQDGSRLELTYTWTGPLARVARRVAGPRAKRMVELEAETFTWLATTNQQLNG